MATQAQWYAKLKGWLPSWFFEDVENNEAVLNGMAKVFASLETSVTEHVTETFIMQSTANHLDEHGDERNTERFEGEYDANYRPRIQNLANISNRPAIKRIVDALLEVGECFISEDYETSFFINREAYCNRGVLVLDAIYNVFSILVDKQVHAPYSFVEREYFADRENFMGKNESLLELFERIVAAVDSAKALGMQYRLIERF